MRRGSLLTMRRRLAWGAGVVLVAAAAWLLALARRLPSDLDGDGVVRIACVGDSNTAAGWPTPDVVRWCEYAARLRPTVVAWSRGGWPARLPAVWTNYGAGGATVTDPGLPWPWAMPQAESAIADHADVVIAAFGTNDVTSSLHRSPDDVVRGYRALCDAVAPRRCLVTTLPPLPEGAGDATTAAVRGAFPRALDMTSGLRVLDQWHLDDASERAFAARVAAAIP